MTNPRKAPAPEKPKAYVWHRGDMREAKIAKIMLGETYNVRMRDLNNKKWTKEQLLAEAPEAATLPFIIVGDKNLKGTFAAMRTHEAFAPKTPAPKTADKPKRTTVAIVKPKA